MKILSSTEDYTQFFSGDPLLSFSLRVTIKCNLRCEHCYANSGTSHGKELELGEIERLLEEAREIGCCGVFYTGGEPFVRRDMVDILKETSTRGIPIYLSSNGTLIDREKLEQLKGIPFRLFQISIDGPSPEVHDKIRNVEGTFQRAINVIKAASGILGKNVALSSVLMKSNYQVIPDVMRLAADLGADTFALMLLLVTGRAKEEIDPTPAEKVSTFEKIFEKYRELNGKIKFASNTTIPLALIPEDIRNPENPPFCLCSFPLTMGIDEMGNVFPCDGFMNFEEYKAGNIRENGLTHIWENSKMLRKLKTMELTELKGICSKCKYLDVCGGGCRAAAHIRYGDIRMPDPVCQDLFDAGLFPEECLR
ncbi:MAG: radical SAM protein [Theionarchaea archaeon]|nr:radical SAM protein [Theionarchaea archaeon]